MDVFLHLPPCTLCLLWLAVSDSLDVFSLQSLVSILFVCGGKTARADVHIFSICLFFSGVSGGGGGEGCNKVHVDPLHVVAFHILFACFSGVLGVGGVGGCNNVLVTSNTATL